MKELSLILIIFLSLISCNTSSKQVSDSRLQSGIQLIDTADMTNNFYDNTETYALPVQELIVDGEIANPGEVDFSTLPLHSVLVKETLLSDAGGDSFVGAYRYDGYSLFDILDKSVLKKANSADFSPIIDLYVEIENDKGEKVVFSWGELYYPNNLHKIIIAISVSRIIPSKTKELWPLPVESKIVAACDLITERNISSPVKITVKSFPHSFIVERDLSPLYSKQIDLYSTSKKLGEIDKLPESVNNDTFNTIFYGRGRGIHSTTPFTGVVLRDILLKYYPMSRENLRSGILCIAGADGYRCAVSYSELFNRNDQQEFLLVKSNFDEDGGLFRIFAAADFFSDRAIKSVSEIHLGYRY
ncbi:MAG TPA: hypothetical protein VMV77_00680 [Bacteroidales bacterium]|nr:hypothetical protein [Bacteroidales bacterium]